MAKELPCDMSSNPQVCTFLSRYLNEITHWDNSEVSLMQKMRDDKFLILKGELDNILLFDSTTDVSIHLYENKAYEVIWSSAEQVILHVAFPVQYELILGMSQIEIEPYLQEYITTAYSVRHRRLPELNKQPDEGGIYHSIPNTYYQVPSLTNCAYYTLQGDSLVPVMDTTHIAYSLSNLFQVPILGTDFTIQVQQSIYGFKQLRYTILLSQWLNYCYENEMTSYVAIEEEQEDAWKLLIVAENKNLAYNHILSVLVPKNFMSAPQCSLFAKINAFIPTHNVKDLYNQYYSQKKHIIE